MLEINQQPFAIWADGHLTFYPDHVQKVCVGAPKCVYDVLGLDPTEPRVRHATQVVSRTERRHQYLFVLKPVCVPAHQPESEEELRMAVRAVLIALSDFHRYGFVHRDVRWPNILRDPCQLLVQGHSISWRNQ
jgi:hypothetical protein